jgi:macrolide transport system ATP-binding/permease protein
MRLAKIIRLRFRSLFSRTAVEQELDEELQYHLEREIDENVAAGMNARDARAAALRSISGLTQRKEECRDMRGFNFFDSLQRDLRYSLRQLRKNLGFAATAVFVLALGMCASMAIFAFVDAALIKPLPYRDPARLLGVYERVHSFEYSNLSYDDFLDWRERNVVFSSFDIYQRNGYNLSTPTGPQPVVVARISSGFLHTFGVTPLMGRDFVPGDNLPSSPHTAMLTYAAWQHRYAGKRDVVGQVVTFDGEPVTIIGVTPKEFHFAPVGQPEFWLAFQVAGGCDKRRSCHGLYGVARLKDGVTMQAALANVKAIAAQLEREHPDSNRDQGANVAPLSDRIVGNVRPMLLVLLGGAALLLLIAAVNVAGLQLVRSESRGREIAVRTALGASSGRLLGQFVTEAVVLAVGGSLLGLVAAHFAIQLLRGLISEDLMAFLPFLADLRINGHILALAALIAIGATALLSLPPSGRIWSKRLTGGLAEASRGSAGTGWRRLGSKLVVVELATAMVLLASAGLLGKSLYQLLRVSVGLNPDRLLTLTVSTPERTYKTPAQTLAVVHDIVRSVEALPGVRAVGYVGDGLPMDGNGNTTWFRVMGRPWHGEHEECPERYASPTYFQTIGAKLISGRYFGEAEDSSKPQVAIVNQAFARKYFGNDGALGKQLGDLHPDAKTMEIVGVVEDIREGPLDEAIPAVLYVPFAQSVDNYFALVVRTSQDEHSLLPTLSATVRQIDNEIVPMNGKTMADRIQNSQSAYLHRTLAWLVGGFAALALLLGVVGLYGVIAYSVSQRSREIGIRMALGAQTGSVYRLILREAGWLTVIGIVLGIAGSIAAATPMRGLLFGVRTWDVTTLLGVGAILGGAAILASFIPARRAASVNPVDALRSE